MVGGFHASVVEARKHEKMWLEVPFAVLIEGFLGKAECLKWCLIERFAEKFWRTDTVSFLSQHLLYVALFTQQQNQVNKVLLSIWLSINVFVYCNTFYQINMGVDLYEAGFCALKEMMGRAN